MHATDLITRDAFLPDVIAQYPATRSVFDRYGLHGCGGELGPREQIGWFARLHGVQIDNLLRELNAASTQSSPVAEFSPSIAERVGRLDHQTPPVLSTRHPPRLPQSTYGWLARRR